VTLFLEFVAVAALILLNGFFVAAEYALVTVLRTKLQELSEEGNRRAKQVLGLTAVPARFIAAMQLGVTVTSLAIGALGEHVLVKILIRSRRRRSRSLAPLVLILPRRHRRARASDTLGHRKDSAVRRHPLGGCRRLGSLRFSLERGHPASQ
jgi:hypothetical protein